MWGLGLSDTASKSAYSHHAGLSTDNALLGSVDFYAAGGATPKPSTHCGFRV